MPLNSLASTWQTPSKIAHGYFMAGQVMEKRYEMALELLGERNEYVDKLEDDIREMKSIFHSQLSLMAEQLATATQAAGPGE